MANHAVVVLNQVQATNIDALIRNFKAGADLDNGNVFISSTPLGTSADEMEVFNVVQPVTGSLSGLWMAYTPEIVTVTSASGKQYRGLSPDPRDFYNTSGDVFNGFKPVVGDIITITSDGISGTISTNTYAVAANGAYKLAWNSAAISGLSLKLMETTYVSIADGSIGGVNGRQTAYRFEVVAN